MAPLELYFKIWVKSSFLETEMGQIACQDCHAGNPTDPNWQTAHDGIIKDPTFPKADRVCGKCHKKIVAAAENSLHYTLAPFERLIRARADKNDPHTLKKLLQAKEKHCTHCHASCGQCHVSRPDYANGGFLGNHHFQNPPPVETTCAACHGGRVYEEFTGLKNQYAADSHLESAGMTCTDCHTAQQLHADGSSVEHRFENRQRPDCLSCHEEAASLTSDIESHAIHRDKLACQVCHSQANKNCFNCHVGTDKNGLPYFKCQATLILFKIGFNPVKSAHRPHDYVVLRHAPANPGIFDFYAKNALGDFDTLPTWKLAAPHNIRRITPQNKECNNCHGNASLFLSNYDLAKWERKANAGVIVPTDRIPKRIKKDSI